MGSRISLIAISKSMNRVKAPVRVYPVQRMPLSIGSALFGAYKGPGNPERVLGLSIAVAPEHVLGLHDAGAAGIHRALPPAVDVFHRKHQAETGCGDIRAAMFGIGVAQHQ